MDLVQYSGCRWLSPIIIRNFPQLLQGVALGPVGRGFVGRIGIFSYER